MDQIRITRFLPAWFEETGISPAEILRQARLPQNLFQQERIVVSTMQWFALWRALAELNTDPALGLKLGSNIQLELASPLSITALSARSFHEALTKMARYKRLFCSEDIRIIQQDEGWVIEAVWLATREPAPALLIDSMFASFIDLGRRGSGRELYPERLLFKRKALHRAMYEAHFHCPVEFEAGCDKVIYSHEVIEQSFRTYNPDLLALLEPQLEAALRDNLQPQTLLEQVKALLQSRLAGQAPAMPEIARELNMSARTLQRRLAAEGAGFQQLLDGVRREMARHYLAVPTLDLNEIAYLLGYEEVSSFHRAFHHWEGASPGQWRTGFSNSLTTS